MRTNRSTVALLSVVLIPSLLGLQMPTRASGATAALSGSIFRATDQSPLAGARLHVGDPKSGKLYSSPPTAEDGSFALADLPAATYQLAVEADGGLYRVETPLPLASGTSRTLNLAVTPQPVNRYGENEPVEEDDDDSADFGPWDNPLSATLVSLGIAAVVGVAVWGSDDGSATPGSSSKFVPED